ncbi:glycosyltransferase [Croceivirga sp. JEA036]|uniref:glycosyltransferase n=1 Tax=Croceivirga sp. JEA036 TaxID=2721162 RepID=UPI00143CA00F|nr:glycosyltransferase [Croceivirga sp. JEA036]NJB35397.1 glycosyltransferase [Croceivirga sp. JEA036]
MAPILLFTYKRLEALQATVKALQQNTGASESELYIFSDGPKKEKDQQQIAAIRAYLQTITGFKTVIITEAPSNKGLASSIIDGVSHVLKEHETVIVLEDDLLTTPNFLDYMNQALVRYKEAAEVFSISGYSFNLKKEVNDPNLCYFLNRGWSWGWATWKDRWQAVDWEVQDYETFKKDKKARKAFAKGGSDLNAMLDKQMTGQLDSWAIRWFYHQFKHQGLTLYPLGSKIYNDGFDADATHTTGSGKRYLPFLDQEHGSTFNFPKEISITAPYQQRFQDKMGIKARIKSKIETLLGIR